VDECKPLIVGSHAGVQSEGGVYQGGSDVGGPRGVGSAGGVPYPGVPLLALPEPIHRTVDFLPGVERSTQVLGRGLHSFTLELNLSNASTHS
jgi:hypothetical protein